MTANTMLILGEHFKNYGKTFFKMDYKEFVLHIFNLTITVFMGFLNDKSPTSTAFERREHAKVAIYLCDPS